MTEEYWKRSDGEVVAVSDMNEHHAKNALRKVIRHKRNRGQKVSNARREICDIRDRLYKINCELAPR